MVKHHDWETIERPGLAGRNRDRNIALYNGRYGDGNWRIIRLLPDPSYVNDMSKATVLPWETSIAFYEEAYFIDSIVRESIWLKLCRQASDVYDNAVSNIASGLDYALQETSATHLQDIAIRNVIHRRGWEFQGQELIQIRNHNDSWGARLSPGVVQFHMPQYIIQPGLKGWWNPFSIEDFWQSNKYLQIKRE
ncbi:MAG: hypothetical protein NDI94_05535 [Candidatus Woesearchaeota archaeon]|nr:hypothetical protein [Candidatus Woesearchaeota archaeon]